MKSNTFGIFRKIRSSNVWVQWNTYVEKSIDSNRLGVSRLFHKILNTGGTARTFYFTVFLLFTAIIVKVRLQETFAYKGN